MQPTSMSDELKAALQVTFEAGMFPYAHIEEVGRFPGKDVFTISDSNSLDAIRRSISRIAQNLSFNQFRKVRVLKVVDKTEKATRIRFKARTADESQDKVKRTQYKEVFVPSTCLWEEGGDLYCDAKIVEKNLQRNSEFVGSHEMSRSARAALRTWSAVVEVGLSEAQIEAIILKKLDSSEFWEKAQKRIDERNEKRAKEYEQNLLKQKADKEIEEKRKALEAEKARKAAERKAARVPDKLIENAFVEWAEYDKQRGEMRKTVHASHGCRVEFYGKKREITLPSGEVISKMEGPNLKIEQM